MTHKKRLLIVLLVITLIYILLTGRVAWVQLVKGPEYQKKAISQWTKEFQVNARRGTIYDRSGKEILAKSIDTETLVASPNQISDIDETVGHLTDILEMDAKYIEDKLSQKDKAQVYIKRKLEKPQTDKIRELKIKGELSGIYLIPDKKRIYPNKSLASHVVGFTSDDGKGLSGVELFYNEYLVGSPGWIVTETDAKGREIDSPDSFIPPKDYYDLILTIDKKIQYFAERELEKAVLKSKAKNGMVVVMDPNNGDILALAAKPDYDLNDPRKAPDKATEGSWDGLSEQELLDEWMRIWRNPIISDTYEPGSTFKIVTSAVALEEGVVKPEDQFYAKGYELVSGRRIKCWRSDRPHGQQSFTEGVMNSCNCVFMQTAFRLGKEKFYKYLDAFGFGEKTGIDVTGEAEGLIQNIENVGDVELATISFGQGISVTPLQLVSAASAVVNGGVLVKPRVALGVINREQNNKVEYFEPQKVRRVISEQTSKTTREILEKVVSDGTGKNAYLEGYRVGGKTGTAQKVEDGKYVSGKYISSFLGIAPMDDPKVVVLVILDEPGVYPYFGGTVAAPVVREIIKDSLMHLGVQPELTEDEIADNAKTKVEVPEIRNLSYEDAIKKLKESKLEYIVEGDGNTVVEQIPKAGAKVAEGTKILVYLDMSTEGDNMLKVPDVKGKSILDASKILNAEGLKLKINGSGIAVSQNPPPGTEVSPGSVVEVEFEVPGENIE